MRRVTEKEYSHLTGKSERLCAADEENTLFAPGKPPDLSVRASADGGWLAARAWLVLQNRHRQTVCLTLGGQTKRTAVRRKPGSRRFKIDLHGTLVSLTGVLIEREDGCGYQDFTELAENFNAS